MLHQILINLRVNQYSLAHVSQQHNGCSGPIVFIIHLTRMDPVNCVLKLSFGILQRLPLHRKSVGDIRISLWTLSDNTRGRFKCPLFLKYIVSKLKTKMALYFFKNCISKQIGHTWILNLNQFVIHAVILDDKNLTQDKNVIF